MTDVLIKRELLERLVEWDQFPHKMKDALTELRALLAAPRQPEGETISRERVQAEADAFFDWPTTDKSSVTTTSCLIFARCIAGMVAAERDATIAELREEISDLHTTMMAAAVEIQEHWQAHCDEEGYGPANLMHRLERGIASQYGYTAQTLVQIEAERDTLRQQLAEARDEITQHSNDLTLAYMKGGADMRQQRDRLAGLLREIAIGISKRDMPTEQQLNAWFDRIDAALAEVNK